MSRYLYCIWLVVLVIFVCLLAAVFVATCLCWPPPTYGGGAPGLWPSWKGIRENPLGSLEAAFAEIRSRGSAVLTGTYYVGPWNELTEEYRRAHPPKNAVDQAAEAHDLEYAAIELNYKKQPQASGKIDRAVAIRMIEEADERLLSAMRDYWESDPIATVLGYSGVAGMVHLKKAGLLCQLAFVAEPNANSPAAAPDAESEPLLACADPLQMVYLADAWVRANPPRVGVYGDPLLSGQRTPPLRAATPPPRITTPPPRAATPPPRVTTPPELFKPRLDPLMVGQVVKKDSRI